MSLIQSIAFGFYVLVGPVCWAALGFLTVKSRRRMRLRAGADAVPSDALPPLTVLIPARNEGERIGPCLKAVLAQDYPNLQVVAVDDRSTDRTADVIATAAASDARVTPVRVVAGDLPAGWSGKNFALHLGLSHATGTWLAFVDADVLLDPHALRTAIALSVSKRCDMASFLPRTEKVSFLRNLAEPLFGAFAMGMYSAALTNHDGYPDVAFANGQFMVFRRSTYEAIGGHAAVADRCCEDVALAERAKATGHRVRLLVGTELAMVRAFRSTGAALRGWGRILYVIRPESPWRILAAMVFLLTCCLSVYLVGGVALWESMRGNPRATPWVVAAAAHFLLLTVFLSLVYHWSGVRKRNVVFFPLGAGLMLTVFSMALGNYARGGVVWRDTKYVQSRSLSARLRDALARVIGRRRGLSRNDPGDKPVAAPAPGSGARSEASAS